MYCSQWKCAICGTIDPLRKYSNHVDNILSIVLDAGHEPTYEEKKVPLPPPPPHTHLGPLPASVFNIL